MKINKLYLIAVGTLLSNQAMSMEMDKHTNHNHHTDKSVSFSESNSLIKSEFKNKIGTKMFVCPMHPEIIQPEMGTCPICGMNLVEKELSQVNNINEVLISQGMQQNMNIKTTKAKMKRITPKIKGYGKVKYNEDTIKHHHLRVGGWIESSKILKEGQFIEKGQKIFELYSEELIVAQQDLILTIKSKNKNLIEKSKKRLSLLGVNKKVIEKITKTKEVMYTIPFYSEKSGYIRNFNLREGMYVTAETELFSIIDQSTYWVDAYIFEEDKNNLSIGSKVEVTLAGNEIYEGVVDYIYPELDSETLSFKYRVTIQNKYESQNLKPNVIVNMNLKSNKKVMGLFVPLESLIQTEYENRIVVKNSSGFVVKEVVVGFKDEKQAQILKGLSLNDEVVTSGQFLIDSEASLIGATIRVEGQNE